MAQFNWETVFDEDLAPKQDPLLINTSPKKPDESPQIGIWTPGTPLPFSLLRSVAEELQQPASHPELATMRQKQKTLLPAFTEIGNAATNVVSAVRADAKKGGELFVRRSERELLVTVNYRLPDTPSILGALRVSVSDHPVVLPVKPKEVSPVLKHLFLFNTSHAKSQSRTR